MYKNRWSYTSAYEKSRFSFTMFLISSTVLLLFILIRRVTAITFRAAQTYFELLNEGSFLYRFFTSMEDDEFFFFANNAIILATFLISFTICCFVLMLFLRKMNTKNDLNVNNRVSFRFKMPANTVVLLLVGLAVVYFFGIISVGFDALLGVFGIERRVFESVAFPRTAPGIIMYFTAAVIAPSILEEFLCRYLMLNALRKYGDGFAITVSSVFFGLLHGRVNAFFFATAIGFLFAYIAIKTKSIWFPIILHAFVNSVEMLRHFLFDLSGRHNSETLFILMYWAVLTALFGITMIYIIKFIVSRKSLVLERRRDYVHISPGRKTAMFFNVATIIFIVLAVMYSTFEYYSL